MAPYTGCDWLVNVFPGNYMYKTRSNVMLNFSSLLRSVLTVLSSNKTRRKAYEFISTLIQIYTTSEKKLVQFNLPDMNE